MTLTAASINPRHAFHALFSIVDGNVSVNAPSEQIKDGLYYCSAIGRTAADARTRSKRPRRRLPSQPTTSADCPATPPVRAPTASTFNKAQWTYNTLSSSADVDWYRFSVTTQLWTQITLAGLTSNYSLDLYSACSTKIATSPDRTGSRFEEIYRELPVGQYYVRVRYISGSVSTTMPYGLRFSTLADGVTNLSSSSFSTTASRSSSARCSTTLSTAAS